MNDPPADSVLIAQGLAMLLSLATLFHLFQRHIDGQRLLAYEPRRPAPWNFLPALLLLMPLLFAWWAAFAGAAEAEPTAEIDVAARAHAAAAIGAPPAGVFATAATHAALPYALEPKTEPGAIAWALWLQSLTTIGMAAIGYTLLAALFGASSRDLGLPRNRDELIRDIKIGATAWAASLAPIYGILLALSILFKPKTGHPLIEELATNHSFGMMLAAAFAAVVAAPIYEETAFRLAFQGWLERREMLAQPVVAQETPPADGVVEPNEHEADVIELEPAPPVTYAYAPPGWLPIIISGTLFGLAHYGHGVSPVPLILLGVVMGYLYQRTHRVTPSIVCHLLFNLFTFVLLALQFGSIVD